MKQKSRHGTGKIKQRGLAETSPKPRFLVVGKITQPHGTRGEIRIESYTDSIERFSKFQTLYIDIENPRPLSVESTRFHKKWVIIKFAEIKDRNSAELLRSKLLQIPVEEAEPLEEGEYYLYQLIGLTVRTAGGEILGELIDIIETRANNVFVILSGETEILLPDIPEVIKQIDFDSDQMTVELMPGLI